ncbi:MAG: ribbon-helix-helix protein, CopG family [Bryobacteraceae bacterium]
MIRIQIRLDKQDYTLIKKEAKALGVPIAELVRRAIRQTLPPGNQPSWMRYAGFVESGNARSGRKNANNWYGVRSLFRAVAVGKPKWTDQYFDPAFNAHRG